MDGSDAGKTVLEKRWKYARLESCTSSLYPWFKSLPLSQTSSEYLVPCSGSFHKVIDESDLGQASTCKKSSIIPKENKLGSTECHKNEDRNTSGAGQELDQ